MQEGVLTKRLGFPVTKQWLVVTNHPSAQNCSQAVKMSCNPYYYAVVRRIIEQGKKSSSFKDAEIGLNVWAKYMHSLAWETLRTQILQDLGRAYSRFKIL